MSLPWSSKGSKATPVGADEVLIIDSEDSNPSTQNKRATLTSINLGSSQTPWLSDIDADGFDLQDLSNIEFRTTTGAPSGTDGHIYYDNAFGMILNAITGDDILLRVNGLTEYTFSSSSFALSANNNLMIDNDGTSADGYLSMTEIPNAQGDPTVPATTGIFYVKEVAGAARPYFVGDGTTAVDLISGGASQTPWLSDIDADGFDLQDLSNIEFRDTTGAPGITTPAIWNDATGMKFNEPTGDNFIFSVNGVTEYTFDATAVDFASNNITNLGTLNTHTIPGGTDTFAMLAATQTLTNKTIDADNNTISNLEIGNEVDGTTIAGTTLKISGTGATGFIDFDEITTPANPAADDGRLYVADDGGTTTLFFRDSAGTQTNLLAGGASLPVPDTTSIVEGSVDDTKELRLEVDGLTTATTRVWTAQDTDLTVAGINVAQTFSAIQIFEDDAFQIQNPAGTFEYGFVASAITADRTVTLPLLTGNDTIAFEAHTQTLTNKTIDADNNTVTNIGSSEVVSDIITGQTSKATPIAADQVLIADSADSDNLKRITLTDLLSGGAQTPWTSDIDADGFDLTDLSNIEFRSTTGAPASTTLAIFADGNGIRQNVPTGDFYLWTINGTTTMQLTGTQLNLNGKDLLNVDFLESDAATPASSGAIRLGNSENIGWRNNADDNNHLITFSATDEFLIRPDATTEYGFSATQSDWNANDLVDVGQVAIGQAAVTAGKQVAITIPDDTASEGVLIQNTDGDIQLINQVATADNFAPTLRMNSANSAQASFIQTLIAPADDTGSTPVMVIDVRQNDSTSIDTRPMLGIRNNASLQWEMDADGTVDMQGNTLTGLSGATITDLTTVTGVSGDFLLLSDTSDSGNLKKVDAADFLSAASQTPWTSDIDADNFSLLDFNTLRQSGTEASVGAIRLINGAGVAWRNNADNADILITMDSTDKFNFGANIDLASNDLFDVGQVGIGQNAVTSGKQVAITIPDDTAAEGVLIQNTDGDIFIGNATGATGEFSALIQSNLAGSSRTLEFDADIPVADDTGTTPVTRWRVSQDDSTLIDNRPLYQWLNHTTEVLSIDANGDLIIPATNQLFLDGGGDTYITEESANRLSMVAGATETLQLVNGSAVISNGQTSTSRTSGFLYVPTSAGVPTGTPVNEQTGSLAMVYDSTNDNLYVYNGSWMNTAGSGAQTPWTSDIDADGFDLTDLSNIEFRDTTGAPAGTVPAIWVNSAGMRFNVPDTDNLVMNINGAAEYTFDQTEFDLLANNVVNFGYIESNTASASVTGAIRLGTTEGLEWVDTNGASDERVAFYFSDTTQSLIFEKPIGTSFVEPNLELFNSDDPGTAGDLAGAIAFQGIDSASAKRRFGAILAEMDVVTSGSHSSILTIQADGPNDPNIVIDATADDIEIDPGGGVGYRFNDSEVDILGNDLRNFGFIESNASTVPTTGTIRLGDGEGLYWESFGAQPRIIWDNNDVQWYIRNDSSLSNAPGFVLEDVRATPSDGNTIGYWAIAAENSASQQTFYAQFQVFSRVTTDNDEEARLTVELYDDSAGGTATRVNYLDLNSATHEFSIGVLKPLTFEVPNSTPASTLPYLTNDANGMIFNTPSGDDFNFLVNGTLELEISPTIVNAPNASFQENGVDISPIGLHDAWIPASAMWASTTNGATGLTQRELATNDVDIQVWGFTSTTTDEYTQFTWTIPQEWNAGTITVEFFWTATGGSAGNVVWGIQGTAFDNDNPLDAAWGTIQEVTDAWIANDDLHISAATGNVTIAGTPVAGEMVQFRVVRSGSDASDTFATTAELLGIRINYTTDSATV